ncbi:helix-turn-helix domain-containing protein [Burkholderia gladioli]|uniref:helix-turn-helix domain-containing protein n=1 Tax=Burkholderia gladioli TaxID=28095 RepID=UPI003455B8AD
MLKLVSEHGAEMALSSVARRTATTPSKAHRYIVSLVEHGMLRQSDVIGLYDLGPAAAAVGFRALNRFDSTLMLQEAMSWLALRTGFPTCFYVWTLTGPDLAAIGARCRRHDAGTQAWSNGAAHRIPHRRRFLAYLRPNSSRQCWRQSASGMRPTSSRSPQQRRSRTKWIL